MKKTCSLLIAILIATLCGHAQVVYFNPTPDIIHQNSLETKRIVIDSDDSFDMNLRIEFAGVAGNPPNYSYALSGLTAGFQGMMDATLGQSTVGTPYWKKLTAGTSIGPASPNFQNVAVYPECMLADTIHDNLINQGDCYLGLKFLIDNNTVHYGWIRVNLTGNTNNIVPIVIKDWAYENTPNTPIIAGDSGMGVMPIPVTAISVFGQNDISVINTAGGTLQMEASIVPYNATNPNITWSVTNGTGSGNISTTGLLTAQTNGTVMVKATAQDGSDVSGTKAITISGQTVGIKEINALASSIYPNPAKNEVVLQFSKDEIIRNIRISNVAGQVVYKKDEAGKRKLITINTASLSEGLYILTFENAEGKQGLQKFVKSK